MNIISQGSCHWASQQTSRTYYPCDLFLAIAAKNTLNITGSLEPSSQAFLIEAVVSGLGGTYTCLGTVPAPNKITCRYRNHWLIEPIMRAQPCMVSPKPAKVKERNGNPYRLVLSLCTYVLALAHQLASISLHWSVFRFERLRLSTTLPSLGLLGSHTEKSRRNWIINWIQVWIAPWVADQVLTILLYASVPSPWAHPVHHVKSCPEGIIWYKDLVKSTDCQLFFIALSPKDSDDTGWPRERVGVLEPPWWMTTMSKVPQGCQLVVWGLGNAKDHGKKPWVVNCSSLALGKHHGHWDKGV